MTTIYWFVSWQLLIYCFHDNYLSICIITTTYLLVSWQLFIHWYHDNYLWKKWGTSATLSSCSAWVCMQHLSPPVEQILSNILTRNVLAQKNYVAMKRTFKTLNILYFFCYFSKEPINLKGIEFFHFIRCHLRSICMTPDIRNGWDIFMSIPAA